jgi:hypothetical protein
MTTGKCMRKNWAWKPVKSHLIKFEDSDPVGTIRCIVESSKFSDGELAEASKILGYDKDQSSRKSLRFWIKGLEDRSENLSNFNRLKSQLEGSQLISADRAIICSRKAQRQISTIRCGAK